MAAVATKPNPAADDDEAWLYGDSENTENREPVPPGTGPQENIGNSQTSAADASQDKDDEDDDSDDDDDDVQVTIGDIKAFPMNNAGPGLYKGPGTYQKQPVPVAQKITTTNPGVKGVDVDAEGTINGVGVFEFSLDSLQDEEKPWRKPGADITDYFNYGFNEDTWRKYCQKQNRLRAENGGLAARPFAMGMSNTVVKVETGDSGFTPTPRVLQAKTQSTTGTIAVLGSTTASRRPMEEQMNDVDQLGPVPEEMNKNVPPPGMPPPGMGIPPPDYSIPPPGMPPIPNFPPAVPPPGMPVPPPPTMFTQPPPVPFYPQPVPVPNTAGYGERPPFSYDNTQTPTNYTDTSAKPAWDSRERDSYRERGRDRDRDSGDEDDYRYSRSRDYSSRDYDRGDFYRSRDSDRSRDRDRSRSRDRDRRQRDRDRDRDDKKSKSRKVKDEPDDSDYYKSSSSKHKKSKRSKRDKDDDRDASGTQSDG